MNIEQRRKELKTQIEQLKKELRQLEYMEKPFCLEMSCEIIGIGWRKDGGHYRHTSRHKTKELTLARIREQVNCWKWMLQHRTCEIRDVVVKVNGEKALISVDDFATVVGIPFRELVKWK
jgi:hypothetical protein